MTRNMGTADRVIRSLVVVAIAALYLTNRINGTLAIILGIFAVVLLVSSLLAWCPGYAPFGWSTRGKETAAGTSSIT